MTCVAIGIVACSSGGVRPAPEPAARESARARVSERESARAVAAATPAAATAADALTPALPVEVPEAAQLAYAEALAAMRSGDRSRAEVHFTQLIDAFPGYPGPYVNLAILYRQQSRNEEAQAMLEQALIVAPDHAIANSELGVMYRQQGDFLAAEAAYERAIVADPSYALVRYNYGVLLELYLRREAEALAQYEAYQALAGEPDQEVARWVIDLRRRLGMQAEPVQVAQENRP